MKYQTIDEGGAVSHALLELNARRPKEIYLCAFEGLKGKIDKQGNIYGTCIGTSTQNTLEDYYQRATPVNDWHGQGPVILGACAAASVLRQCRDKIHE